MIRYVLIKEFCKLSGYTEEAVRKKMENGVWVGNQVVRKAPDGRVMIDLRNYERWVEGRVENE